MDFRVSLALRRAGDETLSAASLAERLAMTTDRVLEMVEALDRRHFVIERHPLQGLRLVGVPPVLIEEELACRLATARIGRVIRCVAETASTNDLAWTAAEEGRETADGLAVFAEYQKAGRGRRGNRWLAPPHSSILCSVLLWVPPGPVRGGVLTRAVALAAAEAVEAETGLDVGIRWPNDLVVDDRKVGGVLVEARTERASAGTVVLGVGINGTQRPEAFPGDIRDRVTSLAAAGARVDRTLLARRLLRRLDTVVRETEREAGAAAVRQRAAVRCQTLGRRISVTDGAETATGEVLDLDPDYGLVLRLQTAEIRRFPAMTTHVVSQGLG